MPDIRPETVGTEAMADNPEDNALVALLESDAMEARAFLDAHNQWMRNPLNRIWFNFIYYRHIILQRLGRK